MRTLSAAIALALGLILEVPAIGATAEYQLKEPVPSVVEAQKQRAATADDMPVYKPRQHRPPPIGPRGRIGSGIRGGGDKGPAISALVPNHVGFTRQAQPDLFWYLSETTSIPLEFTLVDSRVIRPIIETRIKSPARPGVQRISLNDFGIKLLPGVQYKWFITLVIDPEDASRNIYAGGIIERMDFVDSLTFFKVPLAYAATKETVRAFAEEGLWYDAMMASSELIDASPSDLSLRCQRAFLLKQVNLMDVAKYDCKE